MNWYRIDQASYGNGPDDNGNGTDDDLENPYTRIVRQDEIFPNIQLAQNRDFQLQSLDLTYDPTARGPYNFEVPDGVPGISAGLKSEWSVAGTRNQVGRYYERYAQYRFSKK